MDLGNIRQQLDQIDEQIVNLYDKRMHLCEQVAQYKAENGKQVLDRTREAQKLQSVQSMVDNDFYKKGVKTLFSQLMSVSRKLQYTLLKERPTDSERTFTQVDSLPMSNVRVVYQGVDGAYSQEAAIQYFGKDVIARPVGSWREAMEKIAANEADYAVLPIENSTAGSVAAIYDLLIEFDNCIVGEQILKVEHALLGTRNAKLEDIQTVYSHPQALMQSAGFLREHKWEQISVDNTAKAARKIAEENDKTQAAVASLHAAKVYNLQVLETKINDEEMNSTRFIIVTGKKVYLKNAQKVSICFELPHESGSLYELMSNFVFNGINMTKIESRPLEDRNWEYCFVVDFEGNLEQPGVKNALQGIRCEASNLRILGNY